MNKRELRLNKFIKILSNRKFLTVGEMATLLQVSDMTVRRDYNFLQEEHPITMTNGILMMNSDDLIQPIQKIYNLTEEEQIQNASKNEIGRFAASLISQDDNLIFDTGSTTGMIIPHIAPDIKINILCSNLNILLQAQKNPNISISFAGGYYHPNTQMFESQQGIDFIHTIRANKAFISAAGIHENLGITCINSYEVPTKRAIIQSAQERILLVDSSKFGIVHAAYFCDFSDIHTIITDKNLSKEWISIIKEKGITLYLV